MVLNEALLDLYHKGLLGEDTWSTMVRNRMKEKYLVRHNQYKRMRVPTMEGTLIYSAIRGLKLQGHRKTLNKLHQELRDVIKLGLKGSRSS